MITDLTTEHPKKTLWRLALPMFMSVMFQQIYNIADSAVASRFAGEDALAAVRASYPITVILMTFTVGNNLGASVVASRLFGAKDLGRMRSTVYTAFIACGAMSPVLAGLGYMFCGAMMGTIHTPVNIFGDDELYLEIYVLGLTFLFPYNVCTRIFTALGDSRIPLYFLIGSSVGNVVSDYWFVAGLGMGMAGVAWATFIAQGVSAMLAFAALALRLRGIRTDKRVVLFDIILLPQIMAMAVPSIIQRSVLSVGNVFVQEIVNRYGSAVIAGYSGTIKLDTFAINALMSLRDCLSSYTAQNLGVGKMGWIPLGFGTDIRLSLCAAILSFALYFGFSRRMMGLFLNGDSGEVIASSMELLRIVSPIYFMISAKLTTDRIIRSSEAMSYFVLATVPDPILRIIVANLLADRFGSTGIWMAWSFGWVVTTVLTIIFYRRIVTGKYRIRL